MQRFRFLLIVSKAKLPQSDSQVKANNSPAECHGVIYRDTGFTTPSTVHLWSSAYEYYVNA